MEEMIKEILGLSKEIIYEQGGVGRSCEKGGMGSHQSQGSATLADEWLTPPKVLKALGKFDLDPCSPKFRPWNTAQKHYTIDDNGLMQKWKGRVWLNPPYGTQTKLWLAKMVQHGNGVVLTFARTETRMFFDYVWPHADAILFIKGRLYFYKINGKRSNINAGAPSVLIAYGEKNAECLKNCELEGKYVKLN